MKVSLWLLKESFRISASAPKSPQNLDFHLNFYFFPQGQHYRLDGPRRLYF